MTSAEATEVVNVLASNFRVGYTPQAGEIYRTALQRYATTDAQAAAAHLLDTRGEPTWPTWAEFRTLINTEASRNGRHHAANPASVNPDTSPACPVCGLESHWYVDHAGTWYCSHRCKNHPDQVKAQLAARAAEPPRFHVPDLSIDRTTPPPPAQPSLDDEPL